MVENVSWFFVRRAVDGLMAFTLYDRFSTCRRLIDVWVEFHQMRFLEQVGVVTLIGILLASLADALFRTLGRNF